VFSETTLNIVVWQISVEWFSSYSCTPSSFVRVKQCMVYTTLENQRERTCTISSAGKLFSLTGWRVAWALGPSKLLTSGSCSTVTTTATTTSTASQKLCSLLPLQIEALVQWVQCLKCQYPLVIVAVNNFHTSMTYAAPTPLQANLYMIIYAIAFVLSALFEH
jgi:hypothetical protein